MSSHIHASSPEEGARIRTMVAAGWEPDAALQHIRNGARNAKNAPSRDSDAKEVSGAVAATMNRLRTNPPRGVIIRIPIAPPSALLPNKRHRQGGLHPGIEAATNCRDTAKYAAMELAPPTPFAGPVHLTMHIAYGVDPVSKRARRLPDLDATISAAKSLIDGIVDARILYDDDQVQLITASHERLEVTRTYRPAGFTVMQIEELSQ